MKQLIIWIAIMVAGANVAMSQGPAKHRAAAQERIQAQRVAFITQKLALTAKEAAVFWPVYNEYKARQKEMREAIKPDKPMQQMSDIEAQKQIDAQLDLDGALIQLKRQYIIELRDIIPPNRLVRLPAIEQQFNREILNKIRQRQQERRNK